MRSIRLNIVSIWLGGVSVLAAAQWGGQVGAVGLQDLTPVSVPTAKTFKSAVDLVTLNVTVTDGRNRQVMGLGQDDFTVLEDGVPQPLAYFAATEVPLDVAILVDTSSSMRDKMPIVQKAALGCIKSLRPSDQATVVGFAGRVRILQSLSSDQTLLAQAINATTAEGNTALYAAIYVALDQLNKARADHPEVRRRAIIVLTDGEDTASPIQFDDLLDRARGAGVAIYPISVIDESEARRLTENGERRFISSVDYGLKVLARDTGARSFFPTRLAELDGVYKSVADELSMQYALGYVSTAGRADGAYRHLQVRTPAHPELKSRTRSGYFAAGPVHAANRR